MTKCDNKKSIYTVQHTVYFVLRVEKIVLNGYRKTVKKIVNIEAPIEIVFESFLTETRLSEWFCQDAQLETRLGGRFYAYWDNPAFYAMGEFLEVIPNQLLRFTWHDKEGTSTIISVRFENPDQTNLQFEFEHELGVVAENIWEIALKSLKSSLEIGYRTEILERPFLGILGGHFETTTGLYLEGIAEGSSLASAGLQAGDVVVQLGNLALTDFEVIGKVLSQHQLGDTINLLYQRQTTTQAAQMTLKTRFKYPEPKTLTELAKQRQTKQEHSRLELQQIFDQTSELESQHSPAVGSWSASAVLAHLINSERDTQTQVASLNNNGSMRLFTSNLEARVQATMQRYKTSSNLLQALLDTQTETLEMIRCLPPTMLLRKAFLTRMMQAAENDATHLHQHIRQIRRALDSAKLVLK